MPSPSLLIGSDALGWHECGHTARLGTMTKGMPGGDGSLEFDLYGDDAMAVRNVLIPGAAEVRLSEGGQPLWGGVIVSDPVRHRLSCQDVVEVAAAGEYALGGRDGRYGYIGVDTDPEQWRQEAKLSNHSGRFTVRTEGTLEIRADTDRTYAPSDQLQLVYRIHDGLRAGYAAGISFEYKCALPSAAWSAMVYGSGPGGGDELWSVVGSLSVADWTPESFDITAADGYTKLYLALFCDGSGSPASDPWVRLRKVCIYGRWSDAGLTLADDALAIADILADQAAALGVTNTRIHASLAAFTIEQFVSRYPSDVSETLRQACALYTSPLEVFFDTDPVAGTRRFTARPRPADTALAPENRLWVVGGRAGEDTDGLVRDWESTPDQVAVMYAVKDDATLPDGTVQVATYPGGTEPAFPLAEVVDLTTDKPPMTAATAANYAEAVYSYRASNRYTGEVVTADAVHDEHGAEHPAYRVRPGDRLTVLDRDDTDRFGETLYVQGTAYDFQSRRGTVTVGSPFDPLETNYGGSVSLAGGPLHDLHLGTPRRKRPHIRTGMA